jgi:hypothetical protein
MTEEEIKLVKNGSILRATQSYTGLQGRFKAEKCYRVAHLYQDTSFDAIPLNTKNTNEEEWKEWIPAPRLSRTVEYWELL